MRLTLTTPPDDLPVTLDELRNDRELTGTTAHDTKLSLALGAAIGQVDGRAGVLGRALCTQTWTLHLDAFPCGAIAVPLPPLQSVPSITYLDTSGQAQTLDDSVYGVDAAAEPGAVYLKNGQSWPATLCQRNAVTVTFVAGYGDADDVPGPIKSAVLLIAGDLFENREAAIVGVSRVDNPAVDRLLFPFRVF